MFTTVKSAFAHHKTIVAGVVAFAIALVTFFVRRGN